MNLEWRDTEFSNRDGTKQITEEFICERNKSGGIVETAADVVEFSNDLTVRIPKNVKEHPPCPDGARKPKGLRARTHQEGRRLGQMERSLDVTSASGSDHKKKTGTTPQAKEAKEQKLDWKRAKGRGAHWGVVLGAVF